MKAKTGRCEGRKPYGATDGEQAIIARLEELRASGMAFDRIAATLNDDGVPTRTPGKRWHGFAVNQILKRSTWQQRLNPGGPKNHLTAVFNGKLPGGDVCEGLKDQLACRKTLKKMKDKAFARSVNRQDIIEGAQELGVPLEDHVTFCVKAMQARAAELGLAGNSAVSG